MAAYWTDWGETRSVKVCVLKHSTVLRCSAIARSSCWIHYCCFYSLIQMSYTALYALPFSQSFLDWRDHQFFVLFSLRTTELHPSFIIFVFIFKVSTGPIFLYDSSLLSFCIFGFRILIHSPDFIFIQNTCIISEFANTIHIIWNLF